MNFFPLKARHSTQITPNKLSTRQIFPPFCFELWTHSLRLWCFSSYLAPNPNRFFIRSVRKSRKCEGKFFSRFFFSFSPPLHDTNATRKTEDFSFCFFSGRKIFFIFSPTELSRNGENLYIFSLGKRFSFLAWIRWDFLTRSPWTCGKLRLCLPTTELSRSGSCALDERGNLRVLRESAFDKCLHESMRWWESARERCWEQRKTVFFFSSSTLTAFRAWKTMSSTLLHRIVRECFLLRHHGACVTTSFFLLFSSGVDACDGREEKV